MAGRRDNTYKVKSPNDAVRTIKADSYEKKEDYFYFTDSVNADVLTIHAGRVAQIELVTDEK